MRKSAIDTAALQRAAMRLGDAAIDPAVWPDIMDEICTALGAEGALLLQSDARTLDIPRTPSLEEIVRVYFQDGWHARDFRADRAFQPILRGAKVVFDQEVITREEMQDACIYQELLLPNKLQWVTGIGFRAGSAQWGLGIQRTRQQGPFDIGIKSILTFLSDRLTEVATLSTVVGRAALLNIVNALNLVPLPAVAIDRNGFILEANKTAEAFFDRDIHIALRRFMLTDASAKRTFEAFLDRLRLVPDTVALPTEPIVARRHGKPPIIIKILPIDGAARGPFLGARALLLLTELGAKPAPQEHLLVKAYGLTAAEARLASRMATGASLEEIAEEFEIARTTARNQLKAIFAKTGTHRQGELVALLARM
jgi:DNA-binding CsgD family transcriptional regulator